MTKTAIEIDRVKATAAQKVLGTPTLTATVDEALGRVVADALIRRSFELLEDVDVATLDSLDRE